MSPRLSGWLSGRFSVRLSVRPPVRLRERVLGERVSSRAGSSRGRSTVLPSPRCGAPSAAAGRATGSWAEEAAWPRGSSPDGRAERSGCPEDVAEDVAGPGGVLGEQPRESLPEDYDGGSGALYVVDSDDRVPEPALH